MLQTKQEQLRAEKVNYWQPHLLGWQDSQLSATEYCRQQELNVHQFKYWQHQLLPGFKKAKASDPKQPIQFTELKMPLPSSGLEIVLTSGHHILVPDNFHEQTVKRILQLMVSLSC